MTKQVTPLISRKRIATAYVECEEAYDDLVLDVARHHGSRIAWHTPHDQLMMKASTLAREKYEAARRKVWAMEDEAVQRGHAYREPYPNTSVKAYRKGSTPASAHTLVDDFPPLRRRLEKSRRVLKKLTDNL